MWKVFKSTTCPFCLVLSLKWQGHMIFLGLVHYLDQPTRGGTAQEAAMIQVNEHPIAAWVAVNLKLPIGLQTTMYLSTARTTRDQRETWPVDKNKSRSCDENFQILPYVIPDYSFDLN